MTPQLSPESLEQIRAIVHAALGEALDRALAMTDGRFEGVGRRLDTLAARVEDGLAENRRHFGVVADDVQTKVELVIEGQLGLGQKLDREIGALHSAGSSHGAHVGAAARPPAPVSWVISTRPG